ncbi:polyprenyl synthetase family protein [Camelimonas abortus]|uniref:Polyprenyl synthetase family protein n=1 Tax=Camelimonas abortus TaxID=1017184 RepID=A0ABV7LB52_9HYPH
MSTANDRRDSAFAQRLAERAATMETVLADILAERAGQTHPRLLAAMRHAALGGGKRLRPFLTIEAAVLCGAQAESAWLAGAAIELLHCYSLVHDDLPCMDDDDLRRGQPTAHRAFDEATAILAGDALLTLAFEVLADERAHPSPAARAALTLGLARAGGMAGMVGGQMLDLGAEGRWGAASLDVDGVLRLQALKTGALLRFSVEAGGVVAGADAATAARLSRYGAAVGAAFQIADDILDHESDAATLGKRTGKDAAKGKGTLVSLLGLAEARAFCDRLIDEATAALDAFGAEADVLRAAARFVGARRS